MCMCTHTYTSTETHEHAHSHAYALKTLFLMINSKGRPNEVEMLVVPAVRSGLSGTCGFLARTPRTMLSKCSHQAISSGCGLWRGSLTVHTWFGPTWAPETYVCPMSFLLIQSQLTTRCEGTLSNHEWLPSQPGSWVDNCLCDIIIFKELSYGSYSQNSVASMKHIDNNSFH